MTATGILSRLPPAAAAWLRRAGRCAGAWSEEAVRAAFARRGAACPDALIAWERDLRALGPCGGPSRYVLELPDRVLGAVATLSDLHLAPPCERHPGDGRLLALAGRRARGGALYLDERGGLHLREGERWIALAGEAGAHIARLALEAAAGEANDLHLVLRGAQTAGRLAGALAIRPWSGAGPGAWEGGDVTVIEGDTDAPAADVTHAFAGPARAAALVRACAEVGACGSLVLRGLAEAVAPGAAPPARPAIAMSLAPPWGRGEGWIGLDEATGSVEQVTLVDGRLVAVAAWPSGRSTEWTAVRSLEGLSPEQNERLAELDVRRDPRRSCGPGELRALLAARGAPPWPVLLDLERSFGGLVCPLRDGKGGWTIGIFDVLSDPLLGAEHTEAAASSDTLQVKGAWPVVAHEGCPFVAVGATVGSTLYCAETGTVLEHDHRTDDAFVLAGGPAEMVARLLE